MTITSASDAHGSYQTGLFYGGKFKTRQRGGEATGHRGLPHRHGRPVRQGKGKGKKAVASAKRKRRSRHLWGDSHGNFRTVGKSSSASTRGTKWLTKDTCPGRSRRSSAARSLVRDFATNGRTS